MRQRNSRSCCLRFQRRIPGNYGWVRMELGNLKRQKIWPRHIFKLSCQRRVKILYSLKQRCKKLRPRSGEIARQKDFGCLDWSSPSNSLPQFIRIIVRSKTLKGHIICKKNCRTAIIQKPLRKNIDFSA